MAGGGGEFVAGGSVFRDESGYAAYRIGIRTTSQATTVPSADGRQRPIQLAAAPNPTSGQAAVIVQLDRETHARVSVFDPQGREVRRLHAGRLPAGRTLLAWDGRDAQGREVAPGVWFVRLITVERSAAVKLVRR